jgi:hypothetical protein
VVTDRLLLVHAGYLVRHDAERLLHAIFAPSDWELSQPMVAGERDTVDRAYRAV